MYCTVYVRYICTYVHIRKYTYVRIMNMYTVLEIVVSIQTLSDHLGILSDPKKFGSDIWLSTTSCSFHIHSDVTKSFVLRMSTYVFVIC